jgi:hypothetical protein
MRYLGTAWVLLVVLLCAGLAAGQPSEEQAKRADALFHEALVLLQEGKHAEACPLLEESQKLDPAVGTEFNLADCYERTERPLEAHEHFTHVVEIARATGKTEREQAARKRLAALEPRLARLVLQSRKVSGLAGLRIQVGERVVLPGERDRPMVLLPGKHSIRVTADRHKPWQTSVVLDAGGQRELSVQALAPLPREQPRARSAEPDSGLGVQRIVALTAGALGLAALGVGTAFGILSLQRHNDAADVCPEPNPCADQDAADSWTEATTFGNVSTVAFVAGGVLSAGAIVLWFTAPSSSPSVSAGVIGSRAPALSLRGRW